MRLGFECFVGIDWSGNKRAWQRGIKVGIATPGQAAPKLKDGPGPKGQWSRNDVVKWIGDFVAKQKALIGMDFAFGFPPIKDVIPDVVLDWAYVEKLCAGDGNFYGGRFFHSPDTRHSCLINSSSLRGCHYNARRLRATEKAAKTVTGATPQSIFNAVGSAQVGPSSISGMRCLLFSKDNYGEKISIWPFNDVDDSRSVIVEIFPRYFPLSRGLSPRLQLHENLEKALRAFQSDPVSEAPRSEDEGDALLSAAALRCLSENREVFRLPDPAIRHEGWIFGVPVGGAA